MLGKYFCKSKGKCFGGLLIDLLKAFGCLSHQFFRGKLQRYDFNNISLKLIYSYFTVWKLKAKIGTSISSWKDILLRVSEGSISGPLRKYITYNVLLYFLFLLTENIVYCLCRWKYSVYILGRQKKNALFIF